MKEPANNDYLVLELSDYGSLWKYLLYEYFDVRFHGKHWLTLDWYKYVFKPKNEDFSWRETLNCRINGHQKGVAWYNVSGLEPDMSCNGCGDNIG